MNIDAAKQIRNSTEKVGKTYTFNESHDENKPAQIWFQKSNEGLILFIVFYTQACRWSQCISCNLPSKMSNKHIDYRALISQIDYVFGDQEVIRQKELIRKVIISNNGSVLDEVTFSSTALIYLMAKLNLAFSNLAIVSMETRPEYVEVEELEFLSRALREGDTFTELEIAIGFEAFDDNTRNNIFQKGLNLDNFENFVRKIAPYKFRLKCYFMQKPVSGMSDEDAIADIHRGIDYLSTLAAAYNIRINMHLNPTYVASGTLLEESFRQGLFTPPKLIDVAKAVQHGRGKNISIFIGLYDEGLAVEGGSFIRPEDKKLVEQLELFNKTQDYGILEMVTAGHT